MNATDKITALRNCEVIDHADDKTLEWLADIAVLETCEPGDVVFEAGEVSEHVFVLAAGKLEVRLADRKELVSFLEPGALFGEYATFVHGVRTAQVAAATPCLLLRIDEQHFRTFLLRCPEAMLQLLQTAVRRLHRAERKATGDATSE